MTEDIIAMNEGFITSELLATKMKGVEELIQHMHNGGFFTAPCSGSHHLAEEGGLAQHSLNVLHELRRLADLHKYEIVYDDNAITTVALLHDLGKMGDHGKPNYVENLLKSGKPSESKPYITNPDLLYEEHEIRSVIIAERFIKLEEYEEHAILHHNGLYGKLDSSFAPQFDKEPLTIMLHFADLWCSRVTEVD